MIYDHVDQLPPTCACFDSLGKSSEESTNNVLLRQKWKKNFCACLMLHHRKHKQKKHKNWSRHVWQFGNQNMDHIFAFTKLTPSHAGLIWETDMTNICRNVILSWFDQLILLSNNFHYFALSISSLSLNKPKLCLPPALSNIGLNEVIDNVLLFLLKLFTLFESFAAAIELFCFPQT